MAEDIESVADAPVDSVADEAPAGEPEAGQQAQAPESIVGDAPAQEGGQEAGQEAERPDGKQESEDYKFEATEEFNVPQENLDSFAAACREAGLTKAQAEAVLNWHKGFASDVAKAQAQRESQTVKAWQDEILADAEFGGKNWKATVADARKALAHFDTDGRLRAFLKAAKADYHPDVVRVIARVGRAMGEDRLITKGSGGADSRPLEERMWPNMPKI